MISNFFGKRFRQAVLIVFSAFSFSSAVFAAVPPLMTYHGLLKNSGGNFLSGTYSMTFRLYSASTGGTALWTETQSSVSASSGRFTVQLGIVTALNLDFSQDYWLSVQVGGDAEMTPRQKLTTVGYAYTAERVVNGFTQAQHDALSHRNVEGVKDNTVNIAKTNFKLDAFSVASANSMGDMIIDTFNDAAGIAAGSSSNYTWRGSANYDVVVAGSGIDAAASLILHMNGVNGSTTFTDSSNNAKTVTANGNAQISTVNPKFGSGAGWADGASDSLTVGSHSDFNLGTGDFTVDFWVKLTTVSVEQQLFTQSGAANNLMIDFHYPSGGRWDIAVGGTTQSTTYPVNASQWYHVALVRASGTVKLFVNGTQINSSYSASGSVAQGDVTIMGTPTSSASLNGWMDEFRYSKGVARWTSNFTPPAAEYTGPAGSGTAVSTAFTEPVVPTEAIVIADETLNTGTITYYVSRDNGTSWTQCPKETVTNISSQPSGTQLRWKAVITNDAELNSIAVAV